MDSHYREKKIGEAILKIVDPINDAIKKNKGLSYDELKKIDKYFKDAIVDFKGAVRLSNRKLAVSNSQLAFYFGCIVKFVFENSDYDYHTNFEDEKENISLFLKLKGGLVKNFKIKKLKNGKLVEEDYKEVLSLANLTKGEFESFLSRLEENYFKKRFNLTIKQIYEGDLPPDFTAKKKLKRDISIGQGGLCPIVYHHGTAKDLLTKKPSDMHHAKLHNTQVNIKKYGKDVVESKENYMCVNHEYHLTHGNFGILTGEKEKENFAKKVREKKLEIIPYM